MALWPEKEGQLTAFLRWLTHTHRLRWHAHYHTGGTGHIYQGRYKSFPVKSDDHLFAVLRYTERNALRANLVGRAEDWRWGSLWQRQPGCEGALVHHLHPWPVDMPLNWVDLVNAVQTEEELETVRRSVTRSRPYGSERWCGQTAQQLGLQASMRPQGRPRKNPENDVPILF